MIGLCEAPREDRTSVVGLNYVGAMSTTWSQSAGRFSKPVDAKRVAQFVDSLSRFPQGHLIDLGAGHGRFSQIAADLAWKVTAVDVRDQRFPDDPSIDWVVSDVREFDGYAGATVVACLGLWYHLTLEDQRNLAAKIAPLPLILDTHVSLPKVLGIHSLSDMVEIDGSEGRYYDETGFETRATASWGNTQSFWPTAASLERQLYDAGYDVIEQMSPPYLVDRTFFVARSLQDAAKDIDDLIVRHGNALVAPDAPPESAPPSLHFNATHVTEPAPAVASRAAPGVRLALSQLRSALSRAFRARLRGAVSRWRGPGSKGA